MATKSRRIVTFELPLPVHVALQEDAAIREITSIHQRAKEILIDHYTNPEIGELRDSVSELDGNVAYLGELVRRVAFSVIVHAGKRTSKEANEWIRENMPRTPV